MGFDVLQGFEYAKIPAGQLLPVHTAPSENSKRGLDNRAAVSTNGNIYAAGYEGGWLLIMYEADQGDYSGSVHVGYVHNVKGAPNLPRLNFAYEDATVNRRVQLTDDPARTFITLATLKKGDKVTYLSTFYNRYAWDYIEIEIDGAPVRGFVESGSLDRNDIDIPYGSDTYQP